MARRKKEPTVQERVLAYLVKHDGRVVREGGGMRRLAKRSGYSVEALRSFAYNRRTPIDPVKSKRLVRELLRCEMAGDGQA